MNRFRRTQKNAILPIDASSKDPTQHRPYPVDVVVRPDTSKDCRAKTTRRVEWTTSPYMANRYTYILSSLEQKTRLDTYDAWIQTPNARPINTGARPVFDLLSTATIRITVTKANVSNSSIVKPIHRRRKIESVEFLGSERMLSSPCHHWIRSRTSPFTSVELGNESNQVAPPRQCRYVAAGTRSWIRNDRHQISLETYD